MPKLLSCATMWCVDVYERTANARTGLKPLRPHIQQSAFSSLTSLPHSARANLPCAPCSSAFDTRSTEEPRGRGKVQYSSSKELTPLYNSHNWCNLQHWYTSSGEMPLRRATWDTQRPIHRQITRGKARLRR